MSDHTSETSSDTRLEPSDSSGGNIARRGRAVIPWKMLLLTGLYITGVVLAFVFISEIEDRFRQGLDYVMIFALLGSLVMIVAWCIWFLAFSRWRWYFRILGCVLLISSPILFFRIFRPVNGGDANIVRLEPFWARHTEPSADVVPDDQQVRVDLKTETPDDFPRFLGPNADGKVTSGVQLDPLRFAESQQLWKTEIGRGWSGFAARNGYAVTMEQREDEECVSCYEIATGRMMWLHRHEGRHQDRMNLGRSGPRSTPTIHDGFVYAVGAVGNFVCLDGADGSVVWQQNLNDLLGIRLGEQTDADGRKVYFEENTSLAWGRSGSPLIDGELVVIPGGGPRDGQKSTLLAFDRKTGELIWRGGNEMIAYGSPSLATLAGRDQILLLAESKAMGFDPADGRVLWTAERPGTSDAEANTSQVTVVDGDHVLTSKGYADGGGELLRIVPSGDRFRAVSVWKNPRVLKTKLTSPVVTGGHAYSFSNGFLECTRLSDGERVWKRRGRFGHGQLLLVGDLLLVHSEYGRLYLVRATPQEYEELGAFDTIDGVCWNTLCLYGNQLLVRSELEAACFELPVAERP